MIRKRIFYSIIFLLGFGAMLLLLLLVPTQGDPPPEQIENALRFTEAQFYMDSQNKYDHPPSADRFTKTTKLPHNWDINMPGASGTGWYLIRFDRPLHLHNPNTVYIPRAVMNADIFLNGEKVGQFGSMEEPLTRNWNHPLITHFPTSFVREFDNHLVIRVRGYQNYRTGLSTVWFGASPVLTKMEQAAYAWQVTGSALAVFTSLTVATVILVFWFVTRDENTMPLLGLAILCWAVRHLGFFMDSVPLPHYAWAQLLHSTHSWFVCLFGQFVLRFTHQRFRPLEAGLWCYALLMTILAFAYDSPRMLQFMVYMLTPMVPVVIFLNILLLIYAWKRVSIEATVLAATMCGFIALSVRDLLIAADILSYESIFLSQYTGVGMFISATIVILSRYHHLFYGLRNANQELADRLAARERQLYEQFDRLRSSESQRTQQLERQRIMSDIHDGLGSQLIGALDAMQRKELSQTEIAELLQECLDDLRLAIDSLEPNEYDVLTVLGNFRWRNERRLKSTGLELQWSVGDVPALPYLDPQRTLQLLRFVQEAFANIIKHAKATTIRLEVDKDPTSEFVVLRIMDNGVGFDVMTVRQGRGLSNMRRRATELGAQFRVISESDPKATIVELRLATNVSV